MRNKTFTALLALILGIFGIHRFYLGQYFRGALYLVYPVVLLTILFYATGFLSVVREQITLDINTELLPFLLPFLILPVFDSVWFFRMGREKFNEKYNQHPDPVGKALLISLIAIAISLAVNYAVFTQFYMEKKVDVAATDAAYDLSSIELADEFSENEESAMSKYGDGIIMVRGTVSLVEEHPFSGKLDILLEGNGQMQVKCDFKDGQEEQVKQLQVGDEIQVKGKLRELLIDEINMKECVLPPF